MKQYTHEMVLEELARFFSNSLRKEVLTLLDSYGRESWENERERVQYDILVLSAGDLEKLRDLVKLAKTDYRDVLYLAEYL